MAERTRTLSRHVLRERGLPLKVHGLLRFTKLQTPGANQLMTV
jgi:hypothetical protein